MGWFFVAFIALILCLLALDLGVLNKRAHTPSLKEALGWTALWVSLGVMFSGAVYYIYENKLFGDFQGTRTTPYTGVDAMLTYLTGFVLEESLSIDNLFVMVLIFRNYKIPSHLQHRVLFWGILGAIVMRAVMILGGVWLVTRFEWIMYLFGLYLVIQGMAQLKPEPEGGEEHGSTWLERLIGKVLPLAREEAASGHFIVHLNGKAHATPLLVALVSVEAADVVFALDSVPAVLTVSTDPFIVFTSNVFAILGLRSLYFVISSMMDRFGHLKYALAAILVFVGAKMVLHGIFHVPIALSLGFIICAVLAGVGSSMYASRAPQIPEVEN
jgi:tellurite resistance protein TerC